MAKWMAGVKAGHNFSPTTMAFSKCWRFPCPDTPPPTNAASAPGLEVAVGDHWPNEPPTPTDQNATVAAFMLAREASAVLQLHVHGAYAEAVDFHFPRILNTDYGPALGKRRWRARFTRVSLRGAASALTAPPGALLSPRSSPTTGRVRPEPEPEPEPEPC